MHYKEFENKIKEIRKNEEDYCRDLCIKTFKKSLNSLGYEWNELFDGKFLELKDHEHIYLGLDLKDCHKFCISYYNYTRSDDMFPYGELFDENSIWAIIENFIKIKEVLKIGE